MIRSVEEMIRKIRLIRIEAGKEVRNLSAGSYLSAFKGRGMEFEDVRAYEPGDEIRSVDWNVTARSGYPHTKNFREERELTVFMAVDISRSSFFGTIDKNKREFMAEIGAILAFSAVKNNDKIGLLLFSDKIERYIPPGKGIGHACRLIEELLFFSPTGKGTDPTEALVFLAGMQKVRGVVVFLSDFCMPSLEKQLRPAAKKHEFIGIGISDPREREMVGAGLMRFRDAETGRTVTVDTSSEAFRRYFFRKNQERREELKKLFRKVGGAFVDICSSESPEKVLRAFFMARKR